MPNDPAPFEKRCAASYLHSAACDAAPNANIVSHSHDLCSLLRSLSLNNGSVRTHPAPPFASCRSLGRSVEDPRRKVQLTLHPLKVARRERTIHHPAVKNHTAVRVVPNHCRRGQCRDVHRNTPLLLRHPFVAQDGRGGSCVVNRGATGGPVVQQPYRSSVGMRWFEPEYRQVERCRSVTDFFLVIS